MKFVETGRWVGVVLVGLLVCCGVGSHAATVSDDFEDGNADAWSVNVGFDDFHGGSDAGLAAYYPFNSNADDESGNGLNGTVSGATPTEDMCGEADRAYLFDGAGDHIDVADDGSLSGMAELTVACWFQADDWPGISGGSEGLVSKMDNGDGSNGTDSYLLALHGDGSGNGRLQAVLWTTVGGGGGGTVVTFGADPALYDLDGWHHAAVTYDGSAIRLYLDGDEVDSVAEAGALNATPSVPLRLGHVYGSSVHNLFFAGKLDEVRVYDRALSESEIQELAEPCENLTPLELIDEILAFVEESIEAGALYGQGPGGSASYRLGAFVNMLERTRSLIEAEMWEDAYLQLSDAYKHADGAARPPDFAAGEAILPLAELITNSLDALSSEMALEFESE